MTSDKVPSVSIQTRERWYASVAFAAINDSAAAAGLLTVVCWPRGRVPFRHRLLQMFVTPQVVQYS